VWLWSMATPVCASAQQRPRDGLDVLLTDADRSCPGHRQPPLCPEERSAGRLRTRSTFPDLPSSFSGTLARAAFDLLRDDRTWARPKHGEPRHATVRCSDPHSPLSIDLRVGFGRRVAASRAPDPGMTGTQSTGRSARWRCSRPSDGPCFHPRAAIDPSRIRGRRGPHTGLHPACTGQA